MQIIDGKEIASKIYSSLPNLTGKKLVILKANNDPASAKYVEMKTKKAIELGIEVKLLEFPAQGNSEKIVQEIHELNEDENVHGIMLQLPVHPELQSALPDILNAIAPHKDVEGLDVVNLGKLIQEPSAPNAVAVEVVKACLNYAGLNNLAGKTICIINDSLLIGKPIAAYLESERATVTVCNEFTQNIEYYTSQADVIITATGAKRELKPVEIKPGAIVIDFTSVNIDGKTRGDLVNYAELESKDGWYTPVPGSVGPITIACLLRNFATLQ